MLFAKELVGEQYHIHGMNLSLSRGMAVGPRMQAASPVQEP